MSSRVLDSSAVLAYLHREPGYKMVTDLLEESGISTVNVAEVAGKLLDTKMSERHVQQVISDLAIDVIPFDEPLAYAVARLRQYTQELGLSLGDRACLATAQSLGVPAVTADRRWTELKVDVRIQIVR